MYRVEIVGLRDLRGRFASMATRNLWEIQLAEAEAVATVIEDVYRRHAPRSRGTSRDKPTHFFEGLDARATPSLKGFEINLTSDDPTLRGWLRQGTAPHLILPRRPAFALFWPHAMHPVARVNHPGTRPNPWEDRAYEEVRPLVDVVGNRIGVRVMHSLAGPL